MSSYSERLPGHAINLIGLVAPALAGRLAFRLFSATDNRLPAEGKARALYDLAQPQMRQAKLSLLPVAGGNVAAHAFAPTAPASGAQYLVVHGWGSRTDYLQAMIGGLRATGATVVGLDLPGHGASSGKILTVPMGVAAIDAAWRQFGGFDAVIGHSFGGFCAAMSAAGSEDWVPRRTPGKLVLIGAPAAAREMFDDYAASTGFSRRVQRAMESAAERITGRPVDYFAADTMLATRPDLRVLVLHAEDDKEVGAAAARRYAAAGAHVRLDWMNGLGHRRIVNAPEAIDRIVAFLAEDGSGTA